jgi:hypothetical protein
MLIARSIGSGLRQAAGRPALATTLWLCNLLLAAIVAVPAWVAFGAPFNFSPESDQLLQGFNLRFLIEAFKYDRSSVLTLLSATTIAVALVALVGNALSAGGVLEILTVRDGRRFLHRFWRGTGRFFGRFFRLLVMWLVTLVVLGALATMGTGVVSLVLSNSSSELARFLSNLLVPAVLLLVFGFCTLVLDYARVQMALDDSRSAFKAWFRALFFVVRHLPGTASIGIVFAAIALGLFAVSVWYQTGARSDTGSLIALLFLVQQVTLWANSVLRVGAIAGAIRFYKVKSVRPGPPRQFEAMAAVGGSPAPSIADDVMVPDVQPSPEPPRLLDDARPADDVRPADEAPPANEAPTPDATLPSAAPKAQEPPTA